MTSPLLLDTHCLLWWLAQPQQLSTTALRTISTTSSEIFVSAATGWEIATKARLGTLSIPEEITTAFSVVLQEQGFKPLPIQINHALRAGGYPHQHRDPFDRMLAAQAELDGLTLLTNDPELRAFPCEVLW